MKTTTQKTLGSSSLAVALGILASVALAEVGLYQATPTNVSALITPEAGESGVKNVYMGAFYLGKWYLREGATNDWRPYTSGPFPVAGQVNFSSGISTVPIVDFDISYLPGLEVYVGYGVNDSDISSVGHLSKVYTVPGGAIVSDVFSQPWIQQKRSGSGGQFLGWLNGDLASFGRGLMVSKDNGATWTEMYFNGGSNGISLITAFKGQIVSFTEYFQYRSSPDGGQTWSAPKRFPGVDPKYSNSSNTADCTLIIGDALFARSNIDTTLQWVSRDGITFSIATTTDMATLNNEIVARQIQPNNCRGTFPGPANLLEGYGASAIGSRYFRQASTKNPAYVENLSFTRYWNYQLEVSADRINWQLVPLAPSIAFSYISEVSPGRFVGVATQEGEGDFEHVGMTFLSNGSGGLAWTNVGGISGPTREFLVSMATINDVSIAVGADGLIKVSQDAGVSWSQAKTPTTNNLASAASGANIFVVVGSKGTILRSTDLGTTWVNQTSGINDNLSAVAYGGGKFLAVSSTGTALASTDGVAWEKLGAGLKAFAPLNSLQIAYGAGAFVIGAHEKSCVGSSCTTGNFGIFYSQDGGTTWNKASPVAGNTMTFGNGLFMSQVAFGYDMLTPNIMVSGDGGKSWRYTGTMNGGGESMAYGKGVFAGAGLFESPSGGYISGVSVSYDLGATWRIIEIPGGVGNQLFFNGSRWVGLGGYNGTSRTMAVSAPQ